MDGFLVCCSQMPLTANGYSHCLNSSVIHAAILTFLNSVEVSLSLFQYFPSISISDCHLSWTYWGLTGLNFIFSIIVFFFTLLQ